MIKAKRLCADCKKKLSRDEVALSKKMLGRNITEYYCVDCLAELLACDQDDLFIKIQEFKEHGCTLFL